MTCLIPFYILWIEVVFDHFTFQTNSQIHPAYLLIDMYCPWLFGFECIWETSIQQTKLIIIFFILLK